MTRAPLAALLGLCLALPSPAAAQPAPAAAPPAPLPGFDDYVTQAMAAWKVPGLAVAVVVDDRVVLAKGYGVRTRGERAPVTAHTRFAIGSTTKAFTVALLGMLVDEGKLDWDDKVTARLPGFQLFDPYVTREITIRDLVTHRSGLGYGADILWYANALDRKEMIRRIRYLPPSSSFRSTWAYQNLMFVTAGEVAAAVAGRSWETLVAQRIFAPLGMRDSSTSIKALARARDVATPHAELDGQVVAIPWHDIDVVAPAGAINSSAADMAQWLRLQLAGGAYGGKQLIAATTVQEMHTPQMLLRAGGLGKLRYPGAHFVTYGLGWFVHDYAGVVVVEHGGSIDGMSALVMLVPEKKLGVVILSNLDSSLLPDALSYRILDAYLGRPPRDWSADDLREMTALRERQKEQDRQEAAARVAGAKPSLPLADYAGTYSADLLGDVVVTLERGKLVIRYGQMVGDLEPWHFDTFRVQQRNRYQGTALVTFVLGGDGKVAELAIADVADGIRLKRKPAPNAPQAAKQ